MSSGISNIRWIEIVWGLLKSYYSNNACSPLSAPPHPFKWIKNLNFLDAWLSVFAFFGRVEGDGWGWSPLWGKWKRIWWIFEVMLKKLVQIFLYTKFINFFGKMSYFFRKFSIFYRKLSKLNNKMSNFNRKLSNFY